MKVLLLLTLTMLAVDASPAGKWYEIKPASDTNQDARLSEENIKAHWKSFKVQYSKNYSEKGEKERYDKFSKNFAEILKHNSEEAMGLHSYRLGLNEYSDLDTFEISLRMNGYKRPENYKRTGSPYKVPQLNGPLPGTVDWRTKGYVTPVKNQGQCGSCWAFSTTGSVEGQQFKKTGKLVSLSEQNLVDCSTLYGNEGCEGGNVNWAFKYIMNNGIDTEGSYKYNGVQGRCRFSESDIGATLSDYVDLPPYNEQTLQIAMATVGPISVAIDASHTSFQSYSSGVYDEPSCSSSSSSLDHAVLVVGYGTENGRDYWLVKNSWGESWGEDGYIKMSRNKQNQCGIATEASYPVV